MPTIYFNTIQDLLPDLLFDGLGSWLVLLLQ